MFNTYLVLNTEIASVKRELALNRVIDQASAGIGGYCCFVNSHVTVLTKQNNDYHLAIKSATYAFPDGMPVYFVGKHFYRMDVDKISGPDFLDLVFKSEKGRALRHFFYGGNPEVVANLVNVIKTKYDGANIVGAISPPFRELAPEELEADLSEIRNAQAQIVWIGLGAPKQEKWMFDNTQKLPECMLLGVGAAFDFHSGHKQRAPQWMQDCGLEWLHRVAHEPRRLWKRYLTTNVLFIYYTVIKLLRQP